MSLKNLEPLVPVSPFYPPFIPTGSETPVLLTKTILNNTTVLAVGSSIIAKSQAMAIPLSATIIYFTVQQVGQNSFSCPSFVPSIKFADVAYSSATGNMTWDIIANALTATNRPNCLCTVYYY